MSRVSWNGGLAVGLALALLASCQHSESVTCSDGWVCPASSFCREGGGCTSVAQQMACEGKADRDACDVAGVAGVCDAGTCLLGESICGNGVVEPAEICDDENNASGDGCSADCRSDESCGNGIVDRFVGEECEPASFGVKDCVSAGADFGTFTCSATCKLTSEVTCGVMGVRLFYTQFSGPFTAMFGFAGNALVAATQDATYHFDGTTWRSLPSPMSYVAALWGTAPDDVYAAGIGATVAHFDGTQWTTIAGVTGNLAWDVWGTPSGEVYVGGRGGLFHLQGGAFVLVDGTRQVRNGWAASDTEMYIVDELDNTQKFYRFNGTSMTPLDLVTLLGDDYTGAQATDVTGTGPSSIFVSTTVGVGYFDGVDWNPVGTAGAYQLAPIEADRVAATSGGSILAIRGLTSSALPFGQPSITSLWASPDAYFATSGPSIYRSSGSQWLAPPSATMVAAAAGTGTGGFVVASGPAQVVRSAGSSTWVNACNGTCTTNGTAAITAVWANAARFVAVRANGTALHSDGLTNTLRTAAAGPLRAISGPSEAELFAVGDGGVIARWNGVNTWSAVTSPTTVDLAAIGSGGGSTLAVGAQGTIVALSGTQATLVTTTLTADLTSVWIDPTGVAMIGAADGALWKLTGSTLDPVTSFADPIVGVAARTLDDVFVATTAGLYHYDGTLASPVRFPIPKPIVALAASANGLVGVAGGKAWELVRAKPW